MQIPLLLTLHWIIPGYGVRVETEDPGFGRWQARYHPQAGAPRPLAGLTFRKARSSEFRPHGDMYLERVIGVVQGDAQVHADQTDR